MKNIFLVFFMLIAFNTFGQEVKLVEPTKTTAYQGLGSIVNTVAFSPDGQWLSIGSSKSTPLLMNLENRQVVSLQGHQGRINDLKFSPDSRFILTASKDETAKLWNLKGDLIRSFQVNEPVYSVAFSPNWRQDSSLLTGSWKETQLWNINGTVLRNLDEGNNAVFRLRLSSDNKVFSAGRSARFGSNRLTLFAERNARKSLFSLAPNKKFFLSSNLELIHSWNLNFASSPPKVYKSEPQQSAQQVILRDLDGVVQATFDLEEIPQYVLSYTPDGLGFVVGVGNDVVYYNLDGQKIKAFQGHSKPVRSIAFAPDGQHFATGSADYTTKIWSLQSTEVLATIAHLQPNDWAILGPNGLFDASDAAMRRLAYRCNYQEEAFDLSLYQLKQRYFEPGLLTGLLGRSSVPLRSVPNIQNISLFPKIIPEETRPGLSLQLQPRNGGIGKVSLYINNIEVEEDINPERSENITLDLLNYRSYFTNLRGGRNEVILEVYNEEGWLVGDPATTIFYMPSEYGSDAHLDAKPKMHVLSIGTSDYEGEHLDLAFADQDARFMALALASAGGRLFESARGTETFCLTTAIRDSIQMAKSTIKWGFASKTKIKARFDSLALSSKAQDIVVFYFSGHGLSRNEGDKSRFYYLSQGVDSEEMLNDPALREKYAISSDELTRWMGKIKALKKILIIDACNAGQMIEDMAGLESRSVNTAQIRALDRMKDRTGMYVLSGSADNKVSYEAAEFGHGLLTYALLSGMRGSATKKGTRGQQLIDVMSLFQYAADEVPVLANRMKGIQNPMLGVPSNATSFDIGLVDETVSIPIAINKPVLKRSTFMDRNTFNDGLNITEALELLFLKENTKGGEANFVFMDVNNYPKAYSLGGLYELINGQIHIEVKLSRDNELIKILEIPTTTDAQKMVKTIKRMVDKYLNSKRVEK